MKKSIAILGTLALLGSAATMAASVEVRPGDTCVDVSGAPPTCDAVYTPGNNFYVTLHGLNFPGNGSTSGTTGSSLTITYDSAVVTLVGAYIPVGTSTPPGTSPFDFITPPTVIDANTVIISVLRSAAGYASGNFDAYRIDFQAVAVGAANINVFDDQVDNSWTDQAGNAIPMTYIQANVNVIPVPAAAWMLVSALGSLAGIKRLRRA